MPKIKTSELTGPALDWAVAKAEWDELAALNIQYPKQAKHYPKWSPSTDWAQGGPILNRYKISRTVDHSGLWIAYTSYNLCDEKRHMQCDGSELVAGLRCFVASKLGDEVELPEDICT